MFLGTYEHSLDAKNRLMVPAKVRANLPATVVVSKGFDGCLELRGAEEFAAFAQTLLVNPTTKAATRAVLRQMMANAAELEIDSLGRILIPATLLREASITKELVIIGVGANYEIWDAQAYAKNKAATDGTYALLAEGLGDE